MMGAFLLAAAVAAQPAAPSASSAAVGYFQHFCLDHPGEPDDAVTAAETAGWMPLPKKMFPVDPPDVIEAKYRVHSDASGYYRLIAGHNAYRLGLFTWDTATCQVDASPADLASVADDIQRLVGVSPFENDDHHRAYFFIEVNGRREGVQPTDRKMEALLNRGMIQLITVHLKEGRLWLSYGKPLHLTDDVDPSKKNQQTS